jgi:hypothetical protein
MLIWYKIPHYQCGFCAVSEKWYFLVYGAVFRDFTKSYFISYKHNFIEQKRTYVIFLDIGEILEKGVHESSVCVPTLVRSLQQRSLAWRSMESCVETNNVVFCIVYNVPTLLRSLQQRSLAWRSMESCVGANNVVFCIGYNVPTLLRSLQQRSLA